ncbi:hypothetical protein BKA62DRAFT_227135 [Auriculariales sp. MPI-PUGE-AT-0066]|nr:hypothetical protein BKA62DRAFT_227135 [Auriculariales sp. MPI-PUGE-AT-0066]
MRIRPLGGHHLSAHHTAIIRDAFAGASTNPTSTIATMTMDTDSHETTSSSLSSSSDDQSTMQSNVGTQADPSETISSTDSPATERLRAPEPESEAPTSTNPLSSSNIDEPTKTTQDDSPEHTADPATDPTDEVMSSQDNKMRPVIGPSVSGDHNGDKSPQSSGDDEIHSSDKGKPSSDASSPSTRLSVTHATETSTETQPTQRQTETTNSSDVPLLGDTMNSAQQAIAAPYMSSGNQITSAPPAASSPAIQAALGPNPLEHIMKSASVHASMKSQSAVAALGTQGFFDHMVGDGHDDATTTAPVGIIAAAGATQAVSADRLAGGAQSLQPLNVASAVGSIPVVDSATAVRAGGPSGTIIGYTGSAGFVSLTSASTASATSTATAHPTAAAVASKTPIVVVGVVFALVIVGAIGFALVSCIRQRLRAGQSFLCIKGRLQDDAFGELGFGPNYHPFKTGCMEQNKDMSSDNTDGNISHEDGGEKPLPDVQGPAPDSNMPAYYAQDEPQDYRVADYAQGDYGAKEHTPYISPGIGANRFPQTDPWAPLKPKKQLRFALDEPEERAESPSPAPWNPFASPQDDQYPDHYEEQEDRFTPAPVRRTRRSKRSSLGAYPVQPIRATGSMRGPLAQRVLDYYGIDDPVPRIAHRSQPHIDDGPFSDRAQVLHQDGHDLAAFDLGDFDDGAAVVPRDDYHTYDGPDDGTFPVQAMLHPGESQASSMYSVVTRANAAMPGMPAVDVDDSAMSELRQTITQWPSQSDTNEPGLRVIEEEIPPGDPHRPHSPTQLMTSDTQMTTNSNVVQPAAPLGVDEESVRAALRERSGRN